MFIHCYQNLISDSAGLDTEMKRVESKSSLKLTLILVLSHHLEIYFLHFSLIHRDPASLQFR